MSAPTHNVDPRAMRLMIEISNAKHRGAPASEIEVLESDLRYRIDSLKGHYVSERSRELRRIGRAAAMQAMEAQS